MKKKRVFAAVGLALFAAVTTAGVLGFRQAAAIRKYTVVIDAGHGEPDGGATGIVTGVHESVINLEISKKLKVYFEKSDFRVVMTREGKDGLYTGDGNFKKGDMLERRDIILRTKPDLVISVHLNKFSQSYRKGAQVFFKKGDERGKSLADSIQRAVNENLNDRDFDALAGDYYMLNCSDFPSVIVECGFLSNPEEEKLLMTEAYQERIAYCIYAGAVAHLDASTGATGE